ncbi:PQQ-dependent sugar dehydrogenase [Hyphococcus sp.]|uniref:PQQ-dependent sugar dehydrogenase n=1 Tax=Hyphococcus sp. TaxID=2038636 RepID=UPI00208AAE10|nr:MAG: hypothetical protein DHS20C04_04450 [Marinicaulis sp.]
MSRLLLAIASLSPVMLAGCGGDPAPSGNIGNRAPVFTSSATATVAENASGTIYTATANDADSDALIFTISAGSDAALFSITNAGALSFLSPPDFDDPADAGGDNVYNITLQVSDGSASATFDLAITITNIADDFTVRRVTASAAAPLALVGRASGDVFVAERNGVIRILNPATGNFNTTPFLDISTTVGTAGEGGLLGLVLAPDYAASGTFYVHVTNMSGDTEIRSYQRSAGDPNLADSSSGDVILTVAQPADNHNGGGLAFGPDGYLYISLGDGGGGGDPFDNGQDTSTLLAAILRIDPTSDDYPGDADRDYAIPADNPFVGGGGVPEIWAYGLRNPFRMSFDRDNGNLYIGDVGQETLEEIDLIRPSDAGLNFGWSVREGTASYSGPDDPDFTPPIAEYGHGAGSLQGNSLTGGYVYRGPVADLQGHYVFADFISDNIWSFPVSATAQGSTLPSSSFTVQTNAFAPDAGSLSGIVGFGEDAAGNLYILTITGSIFVVEDAP